MASSVIHVRVPDEHIDKFREICREDYGRDANDMIREMIQAFSENRLRIIPTTEQKNERRQLYHESGK